MVNFKKVMLASAGGGSGSWMTQLLPTSTAYGSQFVPITRSIKCKFLSDNSVVDINQRGPSGASSRYTTMTKYTADGDLDTHVKVTDTSGIYLYDRGIMLWVDWNDNDTIYVAATSANANNIWIKSNSALSSFSWYKNGGTNSTYNGLTIVPNNGRMYARNGMNFDEITMSTGAAVDKRTGTASIAASTCGSENLYMGGYRQGAIGFSTSGKELVPAKLTGVGNYAFWDPRHKIGKSSSDRIQVAPSSVASGFYTGASITGAYDLYAAGAKNSAASSTNDWYYIARFANSDGSLVSSKIITPVVNSNGPYTSTTDVRYGSIRALKVGSNGDVWAVAGQRTAKFTILHFSSNFTLQKALTFERKGSHTSRPFSPFSNTHFYSSIDLSEDEEFLCLGSESGNGTYTGTMNIKLPSDLSLLDGEYDTPAKAAGVSGWTDDKLKVYDSTAYFTITTPAYTEIGGLAYLTFTSSSMSQPASPTPTIGADAQFSIYGPQNLS